MLGPHKEVAVRKPLLSAIALAAALAAAPPASANVSLTQVSADPYTNSTSQHATEVEPAPGPPRRRGIP